MRLISSQPIQRPRSPLLGSFFKPRSARRDSLTIYALFAIAAGGVTFGADSIARASSLYLSAPSSSKMRVGGQSQKTASPKNKKRNAAIKDLEIADHFAKLLLAGDKPGVAACIHYPFAQDAPLKPIARANDFIKVYDQYFDSSNIQKIADDIRADVFEHGGSIGSQSGYIWFQDGKVSAINLKAAGFVQSLAQEQKKDSDRLHPSARGYTSLILECSTSKHHLRIEKFSETLKYFTWKKSEPLSEKPEIVLSGTEDVQGTADNMKYVFKNGDYTYTVDAPELCEDDTFDKVRHHCLISLNVTHKDQDLSSEPCR